MRSELNSDILASHATFSTALAAIESLNCAAMLVCNSDSEAFTNIPTGTSIWDLEFVIPGCRVPGRCSETSLSSVLSRTHRFRSRSLWQSLVDGPVSHISRSHSSCSADTCRHEAPTVYTQLSYLDSPRSTSSNGFHGSRRKVGGELSTKHWWLVGLVFLVAATAGVGVGVPLALRGDPSQSFEKRLETARKILSEFPLIDGHNDLPWNIRSFIHNQLEKLKLNESLKTVEPWSVSNWSHTDLPRLKEGLVGGQFWVAYTPCDSQYLNSVQLTLEQIDLIKRVLKKYNQYLELVTKSEDITAVFKKGKIASLIAIEGGHGISNSLGTLRMMYELGVRYLTLTHTCDTPWATSSVIETKGGSTSHPGLSDFGKKVVQEMNRLGMMVDLSHVSTQTMRDTLAATQAPIIFSHSSARALCDNPRNVPDDVLRQVIPYLNDDSIKSDTAVHPSNLTVTMHLSRLMWPTYLTSNIDQQKIEAATHRCFKGNTKAIETKFEHKVCPMVHTGASAVIREFRLRDHTGRGAAPGGLRSSRLHSVAVVVKVVQEMNRLGMMVDLSHVSTQTMRDTLAATQAPIIFSHSSARALCDNPRNVPDDVLRQVKHNRGIVMVSFYADHVSCAERANVTHVAKHINHIREIAGIDHVGIGADFDGINKTPIGLEDVSKYPALLAELLRDPRWTVADLRKLVGENIIRVFSEVERVRDDLMTKGVEPIEEEIHPEYLRGKTNCTYFFD
ncbi:uncharacterized protein LOC122254380 [Penaeus japonicus]|uniref:uncharacterized protein LOC122254380 n=1 Tax=Penaeus japonicus TaxID=27405 RepID=UPI001C70DCC2|nr:uncharacterized protein LOC122254380 [Penaeus japonicus]